MNKKLYSILGINNSASQDEIKKAYRKLAIKQHPDKGGDPEKFKEISEAYSILSDPDKKRKYDAGMLDEHGNNNGGNHFGGGIDPFDVFSRFFNQHNDPFANMSGFNTHQKFNTRSKPKEVYLRVSLEDLYQGKESTLKLTRSGCCHKCSGQGGSKPPGKCTECNGAGRVRRVIQLAPGMVQQSIAHCPNCEGTGKCVDRNYLCEMCKGNKCIEEITQFTLQIKKGTRDNDKISLKGLGDYNSYTKENDDLILVIQQKSHCRLKRKGNDLILEQVVNLRDALVGIEIEYKHLDGKVYTLKTNNVVSPESIFKVKKLGMPIVNSNQYGDLYVKFEILFPDKLVDKESKLDELMNSTNISKPENSVKYLEKIHISMKEDKPSQCTQQ